MNNQNPYYHEKISQIPTDQLKEEVRTEIRYLCIDCGQPVKDNDPEFDYLCERIFNQLRSVCRDWELMYFDQTLKNGMLDEYDRGQRITVKRILLWISCFERSLKNALFDRNESAKPLEVEDVEKFLNNGGRFPQIILFRIQHKPDYDNLKLEEIEETDEFKTWSANRSGKNVKLTETIGRRAI